MMEYGGFAVVGELVSVGNEVVFAFGHHVISGVNWSCCLYLLCPAGLFFCTPMILFLPNALQTADSPGSIR